MKSRRSLMPIILVLVFALVATFSVVLLSDNKKSALGEESVALETDVDHEHGLPLSSDGGTLSSGNYYLDSNVDLTENLVISGTVNLCLNGHILTGNGNGSVITVNQGAKLNLYDEENGIITGGNGTIVNMFNRRSGGGVFVKGTLNMYGGRIQGNTTDEDGGGVYVTGTFNFFDGVILNNYTESMGAGVCVYGGKLNMSNGSIEKNTAKTGAGGVYIDKSGQFIMSGGVISQNVATVGGGGHGGGVYVSNGTFIMSDGTITENSAYASGGGVKVNSVFKMSGGTITNNMCGVNNSQYYYGGGVNLGTTSDVKFEISGNVTIKSNYNHSHNSMSFENVYLPNNKTITVANRLYSTTQIGVSLASGYSGAFTSGLSEKGSANNFFSDDRYYGVDLQEGEAILVKLHNHDGMAFENVLEDGGSLSSGSYYLTDDLTLTESLKISGNVYLCLNGHKLIGKVAPVILLERNASLYLYDCNRNGAVMLSENGKGSVVSIKTGATFNMYNGLITGGNVIGSGGGVYVDLESTFNMYGGKISGNTATGTGGGVYVNYGEFNMHGGLISENKAGNYGGGVYVSGSFNMSGGEISENVANNNYNTARGGGVYVNGDFTVSGEVKITGNTISNGNVPNNVYLPNTDYVINVTKELSKNSAIGVSVAREFEDAPFTSGFLKSKNGVFVSDNDDYSIFLKDNELSMIAHKHEIKYVPKVNPTCETAGFEAYYVCETEGCFGPYFTDINGSDIAEAPKTIAPLGHMWLCDANGDTFYASCLNPAHDTESDGEKNIFYTISWLGESGLAYTGEIFYFAFSGTLPDCATVISVECTYSQDDSSYDEMVEYAQNAGYYKATATIFDESDRNYVFITATFVIKQQKPNVSVSISDWTFGENANEPQIEGNTSDGEISYLYTGETNNGEHYEGAEPPTLAGNYTLTITIKGTGNYGDATASISFTIARAKAVITASDLTVTYDGNAHSITATLNHSETELVYANNSLTNAGSVDVTLTAEQTANYEGASLTVRLTVEKATVNAPKVNNTKFVYNGSEQTYELATSEYYTITNNKRTNAGSQDVVVSLNDSQNYKWQDGTTSDLTYTFEIARADAVITASDLTVTYDGNTHSITATLNHSETELVYDNNSLTNAGSVEVTITAEQTANYEGASLTVRLTVEKATVNAPEVNNTKFVYNGVEQTYELVTNVHYTITNNKRTNAGSQNVTVSLNDKVNFTWVDGTIDDLTYNFTIAKATYDMSSVTFEDIEVFYGDDYEIAVKGTLPDGVKVLYSDKETAVGTYDIVAHFVGDFENYEEIQDMHATLSILEKQTSGGDEPTDPKEPDVQDPNQNKPENEKNSNAVLIALCVVFGVLFIVACVVVVYLLLKAKRKTE